MNQFLESNPRDENSPKPSFIEIYLRMRPQNNLFLHSQSAIEIPANTISSTGKKYTFTKVFPYDTSQNDIFETVGKPIIRSCLSQGKNALIFSYGITNAGKTFTILGTKEQPGLLPRILAFLIDEKNFPKKSWSEVEVECFEIYNEEIHDIFTEESKNPKKFHRETINDFGIDNLMKRIESVRVQSDTGLNSKSSRSHLLIKIYFGEMTICLVDLAGSERIKKIIDNGKILSINETCSINKSLLVLGRCIRGLIDQQENSISLLPFRDSKLTKYLSEFFTPRNSVRIIANISTRPEDLEETSRVLEYTSIAANIKPILIKNTPLKEQKKERVKKLKDLLVDLNEKLLFSELNHNVALFSQEWKDFMFNSRAELSELNFHTIMLCSHLAEKENQSTPPLLISRSINTSPIISKQMSDKEILVQLSVEMLQKETETSPISFAEQENAGDSRNVNTGNSVSVTSQFKSSKDNRTPIKFRLRNQIVRKHDCSQHNCSPFHSKLR